MYSWKINIIDGKSYVVKSNLNNSNDFLNLLFGVGTGANINITHLELAIPNEKYNSVAIVSNHISSVEWGGCIIEN